MVQVLEQLGSISGRIGKGFAKSLSEQLPQEVARHRLSSGLRNLSESKEQNPLKQLADLYSTPGITPEIAKQAQEYMRQQAIINEGQSNVQSQNQGQSQPMANQPPSQQQSQNQAPQRLQNTPEAIRLGGLNYIKKFPLRYRSVEDAEAQYIKDATHQQTQIDEVRKGLQEKSSQLLHKNGKEKYSDVLGELQREFEKRAEDDVISGRRSRSEAEDYHGKKMLDFAKARNKQQTMGKDRMRALFSSNPKKELKAAREIYKDADMPEAFANDLITYQGLSRPFASEFAFPIDEKEKSYFKNIPVSKGTFGSNTEKVYEDTLDRLSNQDSLQNFALQLSRKGYSPQNFLNYALEHPDKLTPRQLSELQNIGSFQPTLSDVAYFTLVGTGD